MNAKEAQKLKSEIDALTKSASIRVFKQKGGDFIRVICGEISILFCADDPIGYLESNMKEPPADDYTEVKRF